MLFLDDLQWAGGTPLGFVDLVLSEERVEGLLLVGAYREGDVDAAHPLAAPLSRWRSQATVRHLRLGNLPEPGLAIMVADMLRVDRAAAGLAGAVEPHTRGNPYEAVEVLNALRRDGLLAATAADRLLGRPLDSPFMLLSVQLSEQSRELAPAVAHRDGSARVQTVGAGPGPFRALIEHVRAATGTRVVLNTSLNRRGEPLVHTGAQAVDTAAAIGLGALVVGDVVIDTEGGA